MLKNKLHGFSFAFYFYGFSFAVSACCALQLDHNSLFSLQARWISKRHISVSIYLYLTANVSAYVGLSVVAYLGEWVMRLNCTNLDINRGWQGRNQYRLASRLIMPHQGKFQMGFDRGHSARKLLFSNRCIITKCNYRNEFAFSSIEECNLIKYKISSILLLCFLRG